MFLRKPFQRTLLILLFGVQHSFLHAQGKEHFSKSTESKISLVENNLGGWVQIVNSSQKWTIANRMKYYHVNGVSIAVINNYKVEWAKAYGWADKDDHKPVTTKTLFQAGSNSKSINAVGILRLAQAGKVDLYSDINDYLKSWKFPYDSISKGKKITLANLLSHTAGLNIHGFSGYERGDSIPSLVEILDGKKPANNEAVHSVFPPSLKYQYSGGGITISQLIAEDVTGEPYSVYMWQKVLKPIGMNASFFTQPPPEKANDLLATGYYNNGKAVKGKYHIYPEEAAAGLWTTPGDFAKFIIETQLSLLGKSNKVLSENTTKLLLTPYIDKNAALGVFIDNKQGVKYFTHSGADEGFVSKYVGTFEGGKGVVVMTNSSNPAFLDEIINSVAKAYNWKNYYKPILKKEVTIPDSLLDAYKGKYQLGNTPVLIERNGNKLFAKMADNSRWQLHFTDSIHFFVVEQNLDLHFVVDKDHTVTGFSMNNAIAKKIQ